MTGVCAGLRCIRSLYMVRPHRFITTQCHESGKYYSTPDVMSLSSNH